MDIIGHSFQGIGSPKSTGPDTPLERVSPPQLSTSVASQRACASSRVHATQPTHVPRACACHVRSNLNVFDLARNDDSLQITSQVRTCRESMQSSQMRINNSQHLRTCECPVIYCQKDSFDRTRTFRHPPTRVTARASPHAANARSACACHVRANLNV